MRPFARFYALAAFALGGCFLNVQPIYAQQPPVQAGQVIISELRLRGPGGAEDEFIELYNNTDQDITVQATDQSAGWSVVVSNGQVTGPAFLIQNGTVIPARGHLLGANSNGYSLSAYPSGNPNQIIVVDGPSIVTQGPFATATPDRTWDFDIPDGTGVALFSTTNGTNLTAATRLDAFGFTTSPALFKEGAGFPTVVTNGLEHTYYRDLRNVTPKDTTDNAADFLLVGTTTSIQITRLGAPGPENLLSPVVNNTTIFATLLDPTVPSSSPPNRERRPTVEPNANLGTLRIRRTFTNGTQEAVSRLRFRVINITTLGTPASECGGQCADVRALTSQDGESVSNGQIVVVRGVRLEEPPAQPFGGAYNSSLSADFITLAQPLLPGQSVNIEFKLGVMVNGPFRFFVNIEADTTSVPPVITGPETRNGAGEDGLTGPARRKRFVWEREPLTPAAPQTPTNPAATPRRNVLIPWLVSPKPPLVLPSRPPAREADEDDDSKEKEDEKEKDAATPPEQPAHDAATPAAAAEGPASAASPAAKRRDAVKKLPARTKASQRREQ